MKARIYILALLLACFTYANAQTMNETIDGKVLTTITTYNAFNNLPESTTYPSGLKVKNEYDDAGRLVSVKNFTTGYTYWTASKRNARGQLEAIKYGNNLVTNVTYNAQKGYITEITTGGVSRAGLMLTIL